MPHSWRRTRHHEFAIPLQNLGTRRVSSAKLRNKFVIRKRHTPNFLRGLSENRKKL